ncbi:hypothetical protein LIA77_02168 [Sarocladium implicatum]|nr:hypothetical protein LIA77_02168 [Sarocladium implicatum]
MSLYRASTQAVRSNLRPCVARAHFHASAFQAVKFEGKDMDDMGGPGGQVPPPQNPGGPDAAKRNWVPIAAGVFSVGAGFWYISSSSSRKQEKLVSRAKDLEKRGLSKVEELKNEGAAKAQQLENKARNLQGDDSPKPLQEVSGRKGTTPFRME